MSRYVRPLLQTGRARPAQALQLGKGWCWFTHVEILSRTGPPEIAEVHNLSVTERATLTTERAPIATLRFETPQIMGILNTTPDSFSDGGQNAQLDDAIAAAQNMQTAGAQIIDVGGESTRPGAEHVEIEEEIRRTAPVIEAMRSQSDIAISIDTRKAKVAEAALNAGATLVNDVAGFTYDAGLAPLCAAQKAPVCVMHAQGDPATMQNDPRYDTVVLDVYDFLAERITALTALGIAKTDIIADPGIGFGKTRAHNLELLQRISLFHSLGVPILLGASRKKFIGTLTQTTHAQDRDIGSIGIALAAIAQGVHIIRAHNVSGHRQAISTWLASVE